MTTFLFIHAFRLHGGPVWRSDAWLSTDRHLRIIPPAPPVNGQLSLFGATA